MMEQSVDMAYAGQAAFRAVMEAFARPGDIRHIRGVAAPAQIRPATAALIQTLADYETPIWLDQAFGNVPGIVDWLRFHTGASVVNKPNEAHFALVGSSNDLPDFAKFGLGSEEYPDRSTTLILQIERFSGRRLTLEGPGLKERRSFAAEPLPTDFVDRLTANREMFPRGIDIVLVADEQIAALPRSVRVTAGG